MWHLRLNSLKLSDTIAQITSQSLLNGFSKDAVHISAQYLLDLIAGREWECIALCQIWHYATQASHHIAILQTGHFICDCMMGTNLGIPCRHFYAVLLMPSSPVQFHLGLFNQRFVIVTTLCGATLLT